MANISFVFEDKLYGNLKQYNLKFYLNKTFWLMPSSKENSPLYIGKN